MLGDENKTSEQFFNTFNTFFLKSIPMNKSLYFGTGVAVVTPFTADLKVDFKSLRNLLSYLIDSDIRYFVAMGTTAESPTVSVEEKKQIFDCLWKRLTAEYP